MVANVEMKFHATTFLWLERKLKKASAFGYIYQKKEKRGVITD